MTHLIREDRRLNKPEQQEKGRRLTTVVVLSIIVLLLMLLLIAQGGFNLSPFLSPDTAGETLLLYALSTLNFLAFITLLFVLLRNVLKLVRERRAGLPGSKFKMRLVGYAIALSLLPALLLFFFAFGLLNRSIDRWFGEPARQVVKGAQAIEETYYAKEEQELLTVARAIVRTMGMSAPGNDSERELKRRLRQEMSAYNLTVARFLSGDSRLTVTYDSGAKTQVEDTLRVAEQQILSGAPAFSARDRGHDFKSVYFVAAVRFSESPDDFRILLIAREFPPELTQLAANIAEQHSNFISLREKQKRIKATYILLLGAVALLLVFAASWLALHVARGITVPIQALAEATDRVAHGEFTHRVDVVAEDELAGLVRSFNQMAGQLEENRESLERAAENLRRTNLALDDRRRYIETVLESLSTGVISTDAKAQIATINRAALYMLGRREKPEIGTPVTELIGGTQGEEVAALCRRARRTELAQAEIEYRRPDGSSFHSASTAVTLRNSEGEIEGWVIVIEDLTDLIQAERASAWSEVAQRMAHEIKNPLTPIQLSAERIIRNQRRSDRPDTRFDQIVREGASTIVREVAALQRMVEEFSRFARLPVVRPVLAQLNDIVRDAVSLYDGRLNGTRIQCRLAGDLPELRFDPEQMKRVLLNLIDNAIEAVSSHGMAGANGGNGGRKSPASELIEIESLYVRETDSVRLIVSDSGHGIRPRDRDKLFLPKFSTRNRGTGLGLAIVSHIVTDHKGRIWVEDNQPEGARFIIELPADQGE